MRDKPGCLSGLLKLAFLNWLFDWLQDKFGFGRGASCAGCGCGGFDNSWTWMDADERGSGLIICVHLRASASQKVCR